MITSHIFITFFIFNNFQIFFFLIIYFLFYFLQNFYNQAFAAVPYYFVLIYTYIKSSCGIATRITGNISFPRGYVSAWCYVEMSRQRSILYIRLVRGRKRLQQNSNCTLSTYKRNFDSKFPFFNLGIRHGGSTRLGWLIIVRRMT